MGGGEGKGREVRTTRGEGKGGSASEAQVGDRGLADQQVGAEAPRTGKGGSEGKGGGQPPAMAASSEEVLQRRRRKRKEPQSENYKVRSAVMDHIVKFVEASSGAAVGWIDCFATAETARFPRFWTRAEDHDWDAAGGAGDVLWMNPPYSRWDDYAKNVLATKALCVCLVPDWGQPCIPLLLDQSEIKAYIPAGATVFEKPDGSRCPPTRWGMWLMVLLRERRLQPPERRYTGVVVLPLNRAGELPPTVHRKTLVDLHEPPKAALRLTGAVSMAASPAVQCEGPRLGVQQAKGGAERRRGVPPISRRRCWTYSAGPAPWGMCSSGVATRWCPWTAAQRRHRASSPTSATGDIGRCTSRASST